MTVTSTKGKSGFSEKIRRAIRAAGIETPTKVEKKLIDRIHEVYKDSRALKASRANESAKVLSNLAVLMGYFGFTAADVRPVVRNESAGASLLHASVDLRRQEVTVLAGLYGRAVGQFDALEEILSSELSLEEVDLVAQLATSRRSVSPPKAVPGSNNPLHLIRFMEDLRDSKAYQEGSPDAVCKMVEHYIGIGALKIADELLRQALISDPEHAGIWFQKARLLLALSAQERKAVSHYRMLKGEAAPLSAAESSWGEMADQHAVSGAKFRREVFCACLEALRHLPDKVGYDQASSRWTADVESAAKLRGDILLTVVREAGLNTDPHHSSSILHDKVLARLGRLKTFALGVGMTRDTEITAKLVAEPLFDRQTDILLMSAYDEIMAMPFMTWNPVTLVRLRLMALNFIRWLAPARYAKEVASFVDNLRSLDGQTACEILGPYDGFPDSEHWRNVMHEHLDAAMDRSAQRKLVEELHEKWETEVFGGKVATLRSVYVDDACRLFAQGAWAEAYETACEAETRNLLKRDTESGAYILRQIALAAAKAAQEAGDDLRKAEIIDRYLSDCRMAELANTYSDGFVDEEGVPFLGPLESIGLDKFAGSL
jgi:hypothetical protein